MFARRRKIMKLRRQIRQIEKVHKYKGSWNDYDYDYQYAKQELRNLRYELTKELGGR